MFADNMLELVGFLCTFLQLQYACFNTNILFNWGSTFLVNHWVGPISETVPLNCNDWLHGHTWSSFRPADRYKNLVMTCEYTTLFGPSSHRIHFRGHTEAAHSKKWRGAPLRLKVAHPPHCWYSSYAGDKPLVFLRFFVFFNTIAPSHSCTFCTNAHPYFTIGFQFCLYPLNFRIIVLCTLSQWCLM